MGHSTSCRSGVEPGGPPRGNGVGAGLFARRFTTLLFTDGFESGTTDAWTLSTLP